MKNISAENQAIDFFIKRGEYAADLAEQHCRNMEFDKGVDLFKQAYGFLKKAENERPEDESIKSKIILVKQKYQEAKKNLEAQT